MPGLAKRPSDVASAFDSIAEQYDLTFEANAITQRLRQKVYSIIESLVHPPARILDINCGTGTDVLYLGKRGFSAVGVDISEKMIAGARRKSKGLAQAEFVVSSFDHLDHFAKNEFDLVLSNFGGLNCTNDLRTVGYQVANRLKPNGYFVAVVMPPFSSWETVAFAARGRFKEAFRRTRALGTETHFSSQAFTVYYHSLGRITHEFADNFRVAQSFGLNIFSPPPHATKFAVRFPILSFWLETIDEVLCRLPLLRSMGDHCLLILQKSTA
jgi:ubiquinone/menaquinone biosynthesis C-methylase UbiE